MLKKFRTIYAASELDRTRLIELGCPVERILMSGNIKFDVPIANELSDYETQSLRRELGFGDAQPFILLGSSTWPGEEAALLEAQQAAIGQGIDCRLLLVPRHAERAPELVQWLQTRLLACTIGLLGKSALHTMTALENID